MSNSTEQVIKEWWLRQVGKIVEALEDPEEVHKIKDSGFSMKQVTDGYHTFDELYYHRMKLFSVICNTYRQNAWKSMLHSDGTMFDGSFIVGVTTPEGDYTYHYNTEFWNEFDVKVLDKAPEYDGHKPSDIDRLDGLITKQKPTPDDVSDAALDGLQDQD